MNLYTTAICPACGNAFTKHLNAIYCSTRCANKIARQRRAERTPGTPRQYKQTAPVITTDYLGATPLDHEELNKLASALEVDQSHGGLKQITFSLEAIGDYQPPAPIKLEQITEYITDPLTNEPRQVARVVMGHKESFAPLQPTPTNLRSLLDLLNQKQ